MTTISATLNPPSEKQVAFFTTLVREFHGLMTDLGREVNSAESIIAEALATHDRKTLSVAIDVTKSVNATLRADLRKIQPATSPKAPAKIEDGFYHIGETVYKVQTSPSTGRQYAKVLDVEPETGGSFVYTPGAFRLVAEKGERLTLEVASKLGHLYGTCVRCGRTLTNEASIEAGIGPICAGKGF